MAGLFCVGPWWTTFAANIGWANTGTDFSLGSNWTGGIAPADNLTGDIATFATATPTFQPNLAANRSVAGISFSNGAGAFTFSGTGTLTVGASGIVNADNSAQTLSLPVKLGVNAAFSTNSTGAVVLSGPVDTNGLTLTLGGNGSGASAISGVVGGAGSIVKSGSGAWTLSGANTFSGGVTLSAGTLSLGNNTALSSGAFIVNGGTINATSARIRQHRHAHRQPHAHGQQFRPHHPRRRPGRIRRQSLVHESRLPPREIRPRPHRRHHPFRRHAAPRLQRHPPTGKFFDDRRHPRRVRRDFPSGRNGGGPDPVRLRGG